MNVDSENREIIYYADDEYRIYCDICDKRCLERYYKNHPKYGTHINIIHKKTTIK